MFCVVYSKILFFCRKPCSNYKMKEITGSGIFSVYEENDDSELGSANPATNGKSRTFQVCLSMFLIEDKNTFSSLF